jgi:hypothetical protein
MGPVEPHGPTGTGGYLGNETGPGSYGEAFEMDEQVVLTGRDPTAKSAYDTVTIANGVYSGGASVAQGTALNTVTIGTNGKIYAPTSSGRVFLGNKFVSVVRGSRLLTGAVWSTYAGGVGLSLLGANLGYQSWGKAGVDIAFATLGFSMVRLPVSLTYFATDIGTGGAYGESLAWGLGVGRPYPGAGGLLP